MKIKEGSSYTDRFSPGDMVSCAFKGHENHGSAPVCEFSLVFKKQNT